MRVAAAWLVHLLTASSAVFALLALAAVERSDWRASLLWLLAALAVDGIDGTLARAARVKEYAGRIDGEALDLIVDFLTYVFVPTLFMWRAGLIPPALAFPLAGAILVSSLYLFARRDMKSEDNYFRGFPSLWNVVALYLYAAQPGPGVGAAVVALFVVLTFAPIHFVHPFRVRDYGPLPPVLATLWAGSTLALLWPGWSEAARTAGLVLSAASGILILLLGLLRTVRGPDPLRRRAT